MKGGRFGSKIRELRLKKGLRQCDLADEVGATTFTVHNWELGKSMPKSILLPDLADALGCTIDELFGR